MHITINDFTCIHYNVIQLQLHNALHEQVFCFIPHSFQKKGKRGKIFSLSPRDSQGMDYKCEAEKIQYEKLKMGYQ